ncbi:protein-disulfide oxidoreductase DsbI [Helicobacter sp. 23-1044]
MGGFLGQILRNLQKIKRICDLQNLKILRNSNIPPNSQNLNIPPNPQNPNIFQNSQNLKREFPQTTHNLPHNLYRLQNTRIFWGILIVLCVGLVAFAHFLQYYLFMRPCALCVYIRYAFLVVALGGAFALLNPQNLFLKIIAYIVAIFGAVRGMMFSIKLNAIYDALRSDEIFGTAGCAFRAQFDFGVPLDRWLPSIFAPSGDCGVDYPMPPQGASFSAVQQSLIELYSDGWYLIPSLKFGTMAECALFAFCAIFAILLAMAIIALYTKLAYRAIS